MFDSYNKIRESYQVLGVEIGTPFDRVRRSYLKLIRQWHPDVAQAAIEEAEDRSRKINEAIHRIKALSPKEIAAAQRHFRSKSGGRAAPSRSAAWRRSSTRRGPWARKAAQNTGALLHRRGRSFFSQIQISRSQAVSGSRWCFQIATCRPCGGWGAGVDKNFRICPRCQGLGFERHRTRGYNLEDLCVGCDGLGCTYTQSCSSCSGMGAKTRYTVRCHIPPVFEESVIAILQGQGHRGIGGGKAGDLYLRVSVRGSG